MIKKAILLATKTRQYYPLDNNLTYQVYCNEDHRTPKGMMLIMAIL